ncbi:hypothetical protein GF420_16150 [candidate division GN15 bacterium]|nr:hypothetical protein [candidate division GN15 bacterium]
MSPKKKIPTKAELLQLQKLYKTDEKIGERLGGVPAYLVAYWRRKKNIPKYSLPKFSESEIRNLWERYGDDEKCGLELGISKAAFYNWRRRYGIREKPAFLKLEQLEFNFPGSRPSPHAATLYGKQTVAQKVLARAAGVEKVEVGAMVEVEPDVVIVNGEVARVVSEFRQAGVEYVWNSAKIVLSPDQAPGQGNGSDCADGASVREFVKRQGIRALYDLREGGVNQVALERGHLVPGSLSLGTDSEATCFGAVSALGRTVPTAALAETWARGKIDLEVPETVYVAVAGRRGRGIYARDIALFLVKKLAESGTRKVALELAGSVVSQMSISERFTLAGCSRAIEAHSATCPYDATIRRYLTGRTMASYKPILPDKDAEYKQMFQISIDQLLPQIADGADPANVRPVQELEGVTIGRVFLGFCTNGRFDDLRIAAEVLKGNKVHSDCQLFILPASRAVYLEALKKGLIRIFVEAGAIVLPPGNESYVAAMLASMGEGEKVLSTGGWTSAPDDVARRGDYLLCSPATAAASALSASITDPSRFVR